MLAGTCSGRPPPEATGIGRRQKIGGRTRRTIRSWTAPDYKRGRARPLDPRAIGSYRLGMPFGPDVRPVMKSPSFGIALASWVTRS
jgi:hypothetical protein